MTPNCEECPAREVHEVEFRLLDGRLADFSLLYGTSDGGTNVAAWEQADAKKLPAGSKALSLHGIYVDPSCHRQGIGSKLFRVVEEVVCKYGFDGLMLKAQQGASGFFLSQGMQRLHVNDPLHQYTNRFWKSAADMVKRPD